MDQDTPTTRSAKPRTLRRWGWLLGPSIVLLVLAAGEVLARALLPPAGLQETGFVLGHHPGEPYLRHDPELGGCIRNRQEFTPFLFVPDEKPEGVLRVAALGGGTIRTVPPDGPAWQLAALLEYGTGRQVQMIAAAGRGFGTARLVGLQRELLGHDLDAVVLYTGHSELPEARSSPLLDLRGSWLQRGVRALASRSRLLASILPGGGKPPPPPPGPSGAEAVEPMGSGERARLLARFGARLETMADDATRARVPSVWVLPTSNPSRPPKASTLPAAWTQAERDALTREAEILGEAVERGDPGAGAALLTLLQRAPDHAGLWYLRGRVLLAAGDRAGAAEALTRARDLDALPARASSAHRAAMTEVARARGIAVVDAEACLLKSDASRYLHGGYSNHDELLTTEAYRIVMEATYVELAALLPGIADPAGSRATLPPRGAPLPSRRVAPRMMGPVLEVDFRNTSHGPAGPDPGAPR